MKRVVVFAMVLMLGVVSVQAQWSVVPEAGMTVMKAGPMVDWKPSWKIVQEILKEDEQKKEQLHEREVRQEEENRQSSR